MRTTYLRPRWLKPEQHEIALAEEIVRYAVAVATEHGACGVDVIEVDIGRSHGVVPEALDIAFERVSQGTLAEGARLIQRTTNIVALCGKCEYLFAPWREVGPCPRCGQPDARIIEGQDIIIESVSCRTMEVADS